MSVLLCGMLDGIMKRFGNSWLREFDEEWRGGWDSIFHHFLGLGAIMLPMSRSYCKTGTAGTST